MDGIWLLATAEQAVESGEGTVVTAEPAAPAAAPATETGTKADGSPAGVEPQPTEQPKLNLMSMLPFILLFVVMYLMLFRGPRKKQQEHQKMVSSLKKNDRVRTIGGIFGVVLDVKDDEIVLKVDESTNTKIRVSLSAIATVLSSEKD